MLWHTTGKSVAKLQGLWRWKNSCMPLQGYLAPLRGLVLWSSGSLVLAHLQILTRQTQLRSRLLLQCSKDLAWKCNFRGALSAKTRVNRIHLITEASCGLCKADVRGRSARCVHTQPHKQAARAIRWARRKPCKIPAAVASLFWLRYKHLVLPHGQLLTRSPTWLLWQYPALLFQGLEVELQELLGLAGFLSLVKDLLEGVLEPLDCDAALA